jgi:TonB family protein
MFQRFLSVVLFIGLFAVPAIAQTSSTPVPPPRDGPAYPLRHAHVTASIMSGVSSADRNLLNRQWLMGVRQKLLMSLRPLIPDTDRPPAVEAGTAVLVVRLSPDGIVRHVGVSRSTGSEALLRAAEGAVRSASPYPPFPTGIKAGVLRLQITFLYD